MFPFFNHYPGTDLHEIDLAYILKLCAELKSNSEALSTWKTEHQAEYDELKNVVDGLVNKLVEVIVPWDSSVSYPIYSIVEYQGNNYIAVKDVPVGTMITNTEFWQPANTVIEQINAIAELTSNINLHSAVNADIGLIFPALGEDYDPVGACNIFYTGNGHACIIDLGRYEVFDHIKNALDKVDVTTIDAIFLTHYHGDHTGEPYNVTFSTAYDQWKNSYDMTGTVFYLPPVSSNYPTDCPDKIRESFPDNEIITMSAGATYTWNDIRFTPYNISASDFLYYDTNSPNDYNNYSAIIYAEYGNSRFLCTGDVNVLAQKRCYDQGHTKHCDIITIPHHGVNSVADNDFINDLSPLYAYIPNGSDNNFVGLRGNDVYVASLYGGVFCNHTENDYGVSFVFGKTGVSVSGGKKEIIAGYSNDTYRTVYVDETYPDVDENGTSARPYSNMRRAINNLKGNTQLVLLSDISNVNPIFTQSAGKITVVGNNHKLPYTQCFDANITFQNVEFTSNLICNDSHVMLDTCTFDDTTQHNRCHTTINNCNFNHDNTKINGNKSFITVNNPTGTQTSSAYFIRMAQSFVTGNFGFGALGTGVAMSNTNGYTDFGRLVETDTVLNALFPSEGAPPFVYDNTNNRLVVTAANGTKYYVS